MQISLLNLEAVISELPIYPLIGAILVLIMTLFIGALSSSSEISFFSLTLKDINYLKGKKNKHYGQIVNLIEDPLTLRSTITTTKILCTITGISITLYLSYLLFPNLNIYVRFASLLFINIVIILILVEIIPKIYARQHPFRVSLFAVPFIDVFHSFFKNFTANRTNHKRLLEQKNAYHSSSLESSELEAAVRLRLGHEPKKEEFLMFKGIMKFGQITVHQVMKSRLDIEGLHTEWDLEKVTKKVIESNHSRMPVYQYSIDQIAGILYTKDLLSLEAEDKDWQKFIRPALYVHEYKLVEDLYQEFIDKRVHIAIVVDEYGGTSGMVTLEDLMEEIVGEITDEFDQDMVQFKQINEHEYEFAAQTSINELARIMNIPFSTFGIYKKRNSTIAGLILEAGEKIPQEGSSIDIEGYQFTVMELIDNRIKKVRILRLTES